MPLKKACFFILFLLLCCLQSFADIFIVTSNSDSGPGTLRDAINQANANGTTTTDYIHFNIADQSLSGRTIVLISELTDLSSNLIIDATTQPGTTIGVSSAKVVLQARSSVDYKKFYLFNLKNASDITLLGMYGEFISTASLGEATAVLCDNSKNIIVGLAGKGNMFTGWQTGVGSSYGSTGNLFQLSENILIQDNIFGILPDGISTYYNPPVGASALNRVSINFNKIKNIQIGGYRPNEGNVINFFSIGIFLEKQQNVNSGFVKIINNRIGTDFGGTMATTSASTNFPCVEVMADSVVAVNNHVMAQGKRSAGIDIASAAWIELRGNKINVDAMGQQSNSDMLQCVHLSFVAKGIIGGPGPEDKNIFAYASNLGGIYSAYCLDVTISKNSFYCNTTGINQIFSAYPRPAPFVTINHISPGVIKGTSLSHSIVELFYNNECTSCQGKNYFATVQADAQGNWEYNGPYSGSVLATATDTYGATSIFSKGDININAIKVIPATCGKNNGAISNIKISSGTYWYWENEQGQVISQDTNLLNASPGRYRLTAGMGGSTCKTTSAWFEVTNIQPPASLTAVTIQNAICGQANGAIYVNDNLNNLTYQWFTTTVDSITNISSLTKALPGAYSFKVWATNDRSCITIYGPYTIVSPSGPVLSTRQTIITPATCGDPNGGIMGMTVSNTTGVTFVQWLDISGNPASNILDLLHVPPGKYRLKIKDQSSCDTITTPYYSISDNGSIKIDDSYKLVTPSSCTNPTGTIRQLQVTGGDSYHWINTVTNATVGIAIGLTDMPTGNYQLIVNNNYGCSKHSAVISIPPASFSPIEVTASTTRNGLCNQPDGFIEINTFNKDASSYTFKWIESGSGQTVGNGFSISNLAAGNYQLLATDNNGCEKNIFTAGITVAPPPTFDYSQATVVDDHCALQKGAVSSIRINGLVGPTTYTWLNQSNGTIGNTAYLQNIPAGSYYLKVTDGGTCIVQSSPFVVKNVDNALASPLYNDIMVPRYSNAVLTVRNPAAGRYKLYSDAAGINLLQETASGTFTVTAIKSDTSFYIQRSEGTCSSPFVQVAVKVVDKSNFAIPNAFTPNGDGKNDRLAVRIKGYIELNYFKIYNRWGQVVFETRKLNDYWDGTWKGSQQTAGGFVWIAEGKDINGNAIKDKGSVLLIR